MQRARTIANWLLSFALIATLAGAPVASALAACGPTKSAMSMSAMESEPACETPCKDCAPDTAKKQCQGDCICAKTMIVSPVDRALAKISASRLDPEEAEAQLVPVHPPDTPPPRTFLA